ncbi:MAG: WD40/YVTN/BNR-like repeat-containing protein [Bacteroidia bacterium]
MKYKILIFLFIIGFISCKKKESATVTKPTVPAAPPIPWIQTSKLPGGLSYVFCLAVSGNTIFAGTDVGVYSTSNNGVNWTWVGVNFKVLSLAISGNNIFAGTQGGGVFLSSDLGAHWAAINNGFNPSNLPTVQSLAINGNNIYAGTYGNGMYMSNNNGASWTSIGLANDIVYTIAINGNNIFAGVQTYLVQQGGMYLSNDNGATWNLVNTGITTSFFHAITVNGINMYAGTDAGLALLSTNNGTSWTAINSGLANDGYEINSFAISGSNIFAATGSDVFLSSNNGTSWSGISTGIVHTRSDLVIQAFAIKGDSIYAGAEDGHVWVRPL